MRRAAEPARAHDAAQVAVHQRDAGALDRDVGAGAHRDADRRLGERRRVVDAVARHRDTIVPRAAASRRRRACPAAAPRRAPRRCPARARRLGGRLVVAGQHDDPQAVGVQRLGCASRADGLDRIGDADERRPARPSTASDHHGLGRRAQSLGRVGRQRGDVDARSAIRRALPSATRVPSTRPRTPRARCCD